MIRWCDEIYFCTPQNSPLGRMIVMRTSFFNDEWLDVPIQVTCSERKSLISLYLDGARSRAVG